MDSNYEHIHETLKFSANMGNGTKSWELNRIF